MGRHKQKMMIGKIKRALHLHGALFLQLKIIIYKNTSTFSNLLHPPAVPTIAIPTS